MKHLFTFILVLLLSHQGFSSRITIISSQQGGSYAVQDTVWKHNAVLMGHNASIELNAFLSSYSNLAETDVLIVSSATVAISQGQIQVLKQFVMSGRPLYLQTEYVASLSGNIAYDTLTKAVGADFQWVSSQTGLLAPMAISGILSNIPNTVTHLDYFNSGRAGEGTGVEKFLEFNGKFYGFYYSDPAGVKGSILTTSDQDWIWNDESPALIQNMLFRLVDDIPTSVSPVNNSGEILRIFPNPATEEIFLETIRLTNETVRLVAVSGQEYVRPVLKTNSGITIRLDELPAGLYALKAGSQFIRFRKD
ncbi:MAG TPA: T9SS type A sorting domain-containing protein [Catalimonadaceae bacterium]|nr:T9SS type A sorting domain-containing protein [Catalimonadaceae bacterium]HPI10173.1 T9SS type A sorting domain-containing protein [Catalimonadaceae bacterium]